MLYITRHILSYLAPVIIIQGHESIMLQNVGIVSNKDYWRNVCVDIYNIQKPNPQEDALDIVQHYASRSLKIWKSMLTDYPIRHADNCHTSSK